MRAEQYQRLADFCAQRLQQTQDPKVRQRLLQEQHDWQELAERRTFAEPDPPPGAPTRH